MFYYEVLLIVLYSLLVGGFDELVLVDDFVF